MDYLRNRRAGEAFRPYDLGSPTLQPYRRAARMLLVQPGWRVLVPGCGLGQGAWFLARLGAVVTGVDDPAAVAAATQRYAGESLRTPGQLHFQPVDLATWWPAPEYDAVIMIDQLEYQPATVAVTLLRRQLHALHPGAPGLFLHLPTHAPLLRRLRRWRQAARRPAPGELLSADPPPAAYTVAGATRLVAEAGGRLAHLELRARHTRLRLLERTFTLTHPDTIFMRAANQLVTDFDAVLMPELDAILGRAADVTLV